MIAESLKEAIKLAVPAIGAFLLIFIGPVVERLRVRVNAADSRAKQFEEFATDLSTFIFHAKVLCIFARQGVDAAQMNTEIGLYGEAITVLRKKEYVYLSWAERYWTTDEYPLFRNVLQALADVDTAMLTTNVGGMSEVALVRVETACAALTMAADRLLAPRWAEFRERIDVHGRVRAGECTDARSSASD